MRTPVRLPASLGMPEIFLDDVSIAAVTIRRVA
jgi:hypothetical protein